MFARLVKSLIEYETPRYVKIHNPVLGTVLRLVMATEGGGVSGQ